MLSYINVVSLHEVRLFASVEEAVEHIGFGWYNIWIVFGLGAVEVCCSLNYCIFNITPLDYALLKDTLWYRNDVPEHSFSCPPLRVEHRTVTAGSCQHCTPTLLYIGLVHPFLRNGPLTVVYTD